MNPVDLAIKEGRLTFHNGRYKYIPTAQTQKRIEEAKKPFNSGRAIESHNKKLMFRASVKEASRKVELIENQLEKGKQIIKIQNKNYVCK
jgi:hypothetical protein